MPDNNATVETIKSLFLKNGGTEEEFKKQLNSLLELVQIESINNLLAQKTPPNKLTSDNELTEYLKKNFSDDEIAGVMEQTTQTILNYYAQSISS